MPPEFVGFKYSSLDGVQMNGEWLHSYSVTVSAVESYLAKSKDGQLGVTGEGTMLDNAPGE